MIKTFTLVFIGLLTSACVKANDKSLNTHFNHENIRYEIIQNPNKHITKFNDNPFKKKYGYENISIISCNKLIRNLAGTLNYGYGAICKAKEKEKEFNILICENQATSYQIKKLHDKSATDLKSIAEFTTNNCYGG